MKISICSDLHLEFGDLDFTNDDNADVLILGGDIFIAKELVHLQDSDEAARLVPTQGRFRAERYYDFVERCSQRFPNVILIAGNHEHYHGDFGNTFDIIRYAFKDLANVNVLDKESVVLDDTIFVGGTLWTDMNKEDPMTIHAIRDMMNDFNCVSNGITQRKVPLYKKDKDGKYLIDDATGGYIAESFKFKDEPKKFSPTDALEDHKQFLQFLKIVLENNTEKKQVVVCGHHAPSKASTHPKYIGQTLMNGGYSSDLSEFILDHQEIKLWTHGHTHEKFDYVIGETRIVCNPRGYINYEANADHFALQTVEI
ncbi:MAG: metallophosphoesterase [Candidatus Nanopelagicus sp.]